MTRALAFLAILALTTTGRAQPAPQPQQPQPAQPASGAGSNLQQLPIVRETLENGLRVVMSPDRTIPIVAIAVYYDVGSRSEEQGRSGFAHLFEHMMFQGSDNVGKMEHFSYIMNRGGSLNGTTSEDRTNYFETLPSNELALGLWLEADRMRSLAVTAENFENQRQTVMEERRQSYENQPYMMSILRINELAYGDYWPYSHSTIGDMRDLENAPLEAVREFWMRHYAPNNAVLSIAGDFEPSEAMALVRQHFGNIPRRDVRTFTDPGIRPQTEERVDRMIDPLAELPAFHIAYHIPPNREPDHYPLEMLSIILGDGESSRLYQELVKRREILQEITVATDDRRGPDLFSFWAIVARGHRAEEAREVIYRTLQDVARRGPTAREVEKAKNRVRAAFVFGLQSNMARAMNLAEFEMYWGDANLIRAELDRYLAVTADDIRRVAGQYFAATNRTVLDVVPPPQDAAQPAPPAAQPPRQGGAQ